MADDDVRPGFEPTRPGEATPNRGKRRPSIVLDGETVPAAETVPTDDATAATPFGTMSEGAVTGTSGESSPPIDATPVEEPSMASAAADLAAPDRPAESYAPTAAPSEAQRSSIMPALLATIGVVLIVLLGLNLYMMVNPPGQGGLASVESKTNGLEQRVGALERRPAVGAALGPLDQRVAALDATVQQLSASVRDANGKVAALASPAAPAQDQDLAAKIAGLDTRTGDLDRSLADVKQQIAALPKPDFAPVDAKVAGVAAGVAALKSDVAALPKVDLAPLEDRIAAVDRRLAPIEAEFAAPKITANVTEARQQGSGAQTRAAPIAVVAQSILQALDEGKGFAPEVAALQSLGVDQAALAGLKPVAAGGAATKADLVAGFADVRAAIVAAATPVKTGTVLDRMMASAQSLVKVRAAGASPGSDPDALVSRIDSDLSAGAFKAALTEWTALPDVSKAASAAWADKLKSRVAAEDAARAVASGAIAALGPAP